MEPQLGEADRTLEGAVIPSFLQSTTSLGGVSQSSKHSGPWQESGVSQAKMDLTQGSMLTETTPHTPSR
jgi:hypothetical protein